MQTSTTFETIIFYAGIMNHIIGKDDHLVRFKRLTGLMDDQMRKSLFEIISLYDYYKINQRQGEMTVFQNVTSIDPLFYYLTKLEYLYFESTDVLRFSKDIAGKPAASGSHLQVELERLVEELRRVRQRKMRAPAEQHAALDGELARLSQEIQIHKNRLPLENRMRDLNSRKSRTATIANTKPIPVLTELTTIMRKTFLSSEAGPIIKSTYDSFVAIYNEPFPEIRLQTGSTAAIIGLSSFDNGLMFMLGTDYLITNYRRDISKRQTTLENMAKKLARNSTNMLLQEKYRALQREHMANPGQPIRWEKTYYDEAIAMYERALLIVDKEPQVQTKRQSTVVNTATDTNIEADTDTTTVTDTKDDTDTATNTEDTTDTASDPEDDRDEYGDFISLPIRYMLRTGITRAEGLSNATELIEASRHRIGSIYREASKARFDSVVANRDKFNPLDLDP